MLKALTNNGTIILGLDDENMKRINRNGPNQPIKFNLKDLGLEDREVVIFHGKDPQTMAMSLEQMLGPKRNQN